MKNTAHDNEMIFNSGLNATQIEDEAKRIRDKIYAEAFMRDLPMYYRDHRTDGTKNFIRANADGSEDLVSLVVASRGYRLIKHLLVSGKAQFAHLATKTNNSNI